jgi:biopolymer transport protein TolQ
MMLFATGNPFITAYVQSDWFGKGIFWGLFALSAGSWTLLAHKSWLFYQVRQMTEEFLGLFSEREPLGLQFVKPMKGGILEAPHPLFEIYKACKRKALQVLEKNRQFGEAGFSDADLALIESEAESAIVKQHKELEKNLFMLSTIATLGPFLGLLGTVWGILLTFGALQGRASGNSAMLAGLSMALATTVVGLLIAIPALAGYNYLKNASREYRRDMETFSRQLIAAVELQHRRPDYASKDSPVS